jgi:hypothetical protein
MLRHSVLLQLVSVAKTNMAVEWDRGYLTAGQTATRGDRFRANPWARLVSKPAAMAPIYLARR